MPARTSSTARGGSGAYDQTVYTQAVDGSFVPVVAEDLPPDHADAGAPPSPLLSQWHLYLYLPDHSMQRHSFRTPALGCPAGRQRSAPSSLHSSARFGSAPATMQPAGLACSQLAPRPVIHAEPPRAAAHRRIGASVRMIKAQTCPRLRTYRITVVITKGSAHLPPPFWSTVYHCKGY